MTRGSGPRQRDGADTVIVTQIFHLESYSPLSGCWFRSGPAATDLQVVRRELDQSRAICGVVSLRIVDDAGTVIDSYNPHPRVR